MGTQPMFSSETDKEIPFICTKAQTCYTNDYLALLTMTVFPDHPLNHLSVVSPAGSAGVQALFACLKQKLTMSENGASWEGRAQLDV